MLPSFNSIKTETFSFSDRDLVSRTVYSSSTDIFDPEQLNKDLLTVKDSSTLHPKRVCRTSDYRNRNEYMRYYRLRCKLVKLGLISCFKKYSKVNFYVLSQKACSISFAVNPIRDFLYFDFFIYIY